MRRFNKGFSLVELMIVVAIIGILAAIAIPNFISMQNKAKRSEAPGNVDGIKTAELAYDAAYDGFIAAADAPTTGALTKSQVTWTTNAGFDSLGWSPDGNVRGQYRATTTGSTDFTVTGTIDVDDDNNNATYTATKSLNATQTSANNVY